MAKQRIPIERTAAIYARVSTTSGQTTENQVRELRKAAKRMGWTVAEEFVDNGVSGSKDTRPAFDKLRKTIARKEIDVVMVWSVDRIGRSLQNLCAFLGELHAKGVDLYLDRQGIDTTTPGGKALFQMMGVFSEFEREMLIERTHAGLARARAQGKRLGRPPVATPAVVHRIRRMREKEQASIREIADAVGISKESVRRIVAAS